MRTEDIHAAYLSFSARRWRVGKMCRAGENHKHRRSHSWNVHTSDAGVVCGLLSFNWLILQKGHRFIDL